MNIDGLNAIAKKMVAKGKGILAADESSGTIKKRFDKIGVESTEANRRDYRELLFRSKDGMKHISGVILFDETIRQKAKDGTPLVKLIEEAGAVPGIKVDAGAKPLAFSKGETITEGLDGLRERLMEYHKLGARFAKWRATYDPTDGRPSYNCINANAQALARYAALCQEQDIVPIVEPEVLMDGDNDIATCSAVTEWVLKDVFQQLYYANVALEGMVLKPNMAISGLKCAKQASVEEGADETVKILMRCVPAAVPGIAFLSGGQSRSEAQRGDLGPQMRQAGKRRGSGRRDGEDPHALRAGGGAGHRLPFGRPIRRGRDRASERDERAASEPALGAHFLLWARAAGRTAKGLERQVGQRAGGASGLRPPRQDEWPGDNRRLEDGDGETGGVNEG